MRHCPKHFQQPGPSACRLAGRALGCSKSQFASTMSELCDELTVNQSRLLKSQKFWCWQRSHCERGPWNS